MFHLLLGFAENQGVFWDFKIQNSVRITEGSDNENSDNRGPTVLACLLLAHMAPPYIWMLVGYFTLRGHLVLRSQTFFHRALID